MALVLILSQAPSFGQGIGSLAVTIYDGKTGETVPGVALQLSNVNKLVAPTTMLTDAKGFAEFPVLPSGAGYVLEISSPGFATQRISDIRVRLGDTEQVVLQLSPELQESIRVTAKKSIVDLDRTHASTKFSAELIEQLPIPGRFYQNILQLVPGVNDADGDGNPNVHGGRARDFRAEISGISNVDPLTGKRLSYVNLESIEEMEVVSDSASVEFGGAQAGFGRIIQKQGSNLFEGVFEFIFASSKLDGNGATNLPDDQLPEFERLQPTFHISGPIVKDRLWFRLSHTYIDREDPVNVLNGVALIGLEQEINSDQITWQASPRNKLMFSFQTDPLKASNVDVSSQVPAESTQSIDQGGDTYTLTWVAPQSAKLLVESAVAWQDHDFNIFPSEANHPQNCARFPLVFESLNRTRCFYTNTATFSGGHPETWSDDRQRFTVRSKATWYLGRFAGVSHQLKFGFIIENERYFRDLSRRPDVTFQSFTPAFGDPFGVATVEVPVPGSSSSRTAATHWGVYLEEKLKPVSNLAITLGVRLDSSSIEARGVSPFDPQAEATEFFKRFESGALPFTIAPQVFTAYPDVIDLQREMAAVLNVSTDDLPLDGNALQSAFWANKQGIVEIDVHDTRVSPRGSIAWDPGGDGKTKIVVSGGRYYDSIFLAIPLLEQEPITTNLAFSAFTRTPFFNEFFINTGNNSVSPVANARAVSRDLRTPYQDEFVVSFERSLWTESSIELRYVKRKFKDQFQDVDINHVGSRVLNPGWGEIFFLGNFDTADYEGVILEFTRRQYRGWEMNTSYTWSEVVGDAEDFNQLLGNNRDLRDTERSYLSYDQRHVFRLIASAIIPGGVRLATVTRWESGLPYSNVSSRPFQFQTPAEYGTVGTPTRQIRFVYPSGKRNDQRNASFWTFDARISKNFTLGRKMNLELSAEVFNLLNDDRLLERDRVNGRLDATRRFGRRYQLGFRLGF